MHGNKQWRPVKEIKKGDQVDDQEEEAEEEGEDVDEKKGAVRKLSRMRQARPNKN